MIIAGLSTGYPVIHFRLDPNWPISNEMAAVEKIFKRYNPQYAFEWNFVDDAYNSKFRAEQQEGDTGNSLCRPHDLYLLSGAFWSVRRHGREQNPRDRHS